MIFLSEKLTFLEYTRVTFVTNVAAVQSSMVVQA